MQHGHSVQLARVVLGGWETVRIGGSLTMQTVQNWGDAVLVSVTTALQNLLGFLPALIGAIIVLILGWIIAGLLAGTVIRLAHFRVKAYAEEQTARRTMARELPERHR